MLTSLSFIFNFGNKYSLYFNIGLEISLLSSLISKNDLLSSNIFTNYSDYEFYKYLI